MFARWAVFLVSAVLYPYSCVKGIAISLTEYTVNWLHHTLPDSAALSVHIHQSHAYCHHNVQTHAQLNKNHKHSYHDHRRMHVREMISPAPTCRRWTVHYHHTSSASCLGVRMGKLGMISECIRMEWSGAPGRTGWAPDLHHSQPSSRHTTTHPHHYTFTRTTLHSQCWW